MEGARTGVATQESTDSLARPTVFHVLLYRGLFLGSDWGAMFFAMRTRPIAFGNGLVVRIDADRMVGSRTGIAEDDLPSVFANLTEVLMLVFLALLLLHLAYLAHLFQSGLLFVVTGSSTASTTFLLLYVLLVQVLLSLLQELLELGITVTLILVVWIVAASLGGLTGRDADAQRSHGLVSSDGGSSDYLFTTASSGKIDIRHW